MTDDTSTQGETPTSGPRKSPETAGGQRPTTTHGAHLESVEVDTIDGHWVMPAEVEDDRAGQNDLLIQDTTGAPVAESVNDGTVGASAHTQPVGVDTIDGHWVVPADGEHGPVEPRRILQQESTGAPVADERDAERNGFLRS